MLTVFLFRFPDPRLPSAALLSEYGKQSWRRLGARKPRLWKNARRRKYNIDYPSMPQRSDSTVPRDGIRIPCLGTKSCAISA